MREKAKKPIVFIVEDSCAYRILLGRVLQQRGFLVLLFPDGLQALEMIDYIKPDIILSDIQMPNMDGFELNEAIEEKYSHLKIPIQYISSTNSIETIQKANLISVNHLIKKPVVPEMLSDLLNSVIEKSAA